MNSKDLNSINEAFATARAKVVAEDSKTDETPIIENTETVNEIAPAVAAGIGAATNLAAGKNIGEALKGGLSGYTFGKALTGIGSLGGTSAADFAKKGLVGKIQSVGGGLASLPGEGFLGKATELISIGGIGEDPS